VIARKLTSAAQRTRLVSYLFLLVMILGSIGLDQATKFHSEETLMAWSHETDPNLYKGSRYPIASAGSVTPGEETSAYFYFGFNYVRNLGAAWGALSNLPDKIRVPFFYVVTIVAVFIIGLYIRSTPVEHRLAIFALGLILSGAIGNFIDRLRLGYVIDWIDVRWNLAGWRYDFPNFNIADSAITVGVGFLLFDMLILENLRRRSQKADAAPAQVKA
jgi:signal peptidase II